MSTAQSFQLHRLQTSPTAFFQRFIKHSRTLVGLVALSLMLFSGIAGCDDEQFTKGGAAILIVDPGAVSFTALPVGEAERQRVIIRNEGTSSLVLPFDRYTMTPSDADFLFSYMTVDGEEVDSLKPNGEAELFITYQPTSETLSSAILTLNSLNGGSQDISITTGRPIPRLQVTPDPIVYGFVAEGGKEVKSVELVNRGTADLLITNLYYQPVNTTDFEITKPPTLPLLLTPNSTASMEITYTPTGNPKEQDLGEVIFESNDRGNTGNLSSVEIKGGEGLPIIEVEPIFVDFGSLAGIGDVAEQSVLVRNIGEGTLNVSSILLSLGSSTDFSYTGDETLLLEAGDPPVLLSIGYSPSDPGDDIGHLALQSNDPFNPVVLVQLTGSLAEALLRVEPEVLDFGTILINTNQTLNFEVANDGQLDLAISDIIEGNFPADGSLSFEVQGENSTPFLIAPGEARTVDVTYAPTAIVPYSVSNLEVQSTALTDPNRSVELRYQSVDSGGCPGGYIVTPLTLNYGTVSRGDQLAKSFNVTNCGATDVQIMQIKRGMGSLGGLFPLPVPTPSEFQVTAGGSPVLIPPNGSHTVEVTFSPSLAGYLNGSFIVVTNVAGNSETSVEVRGNSEPPPITELDFHVEVTWDNSTDVDTHLIRLPNGGFFCDTDCNFTNMSPSWDQPGVADDPFLDLDNISGFGPENINMESPVDGNRYRLVLHYYSDDGNGSSNTLVKLYNRGNLVQSWSNTLNSTGDTWDVFEIDWATQNITTFGNSLYNGGNSCGPNIP